MKVADFGLSRVVADLNTMTGGLGAGDPSALPLWLLLMTARDFMCCDLFRFSHNHAGQPRLFSVAAERRCSSLRL